MGLAWSRPIVSQRLVLVSSVVASYVAAFVGGDGHLLCDVAADGLVVRQ